MKVQIISDLHLEFGNTYKDYYERMINTKADLLVLAGDINVNSSLFNSLISIQEDADKDIIFVPGNHEYYGVRKDRFDRELIEFNKSQSNIHILMEDTIDFENIHFIGTTGWWDGSNGPLTPSVIRCLNDFYRIFDIMNEGNDKGITWGKQSKSFLKEELENSYDKVCVITHHYPHYKSLDTQYKSSELNTCFGNKWEYLIEDYQPDCWIHGHTHTSFDYNVGKTRIVCNPQGYIIDDLENKRFEPDKVIEL